MREMGTCQSKIHDGLSDVTHDDDNSNVTSNDGKSSQLGNEELSSTSSLKGNDEAGKEIKFGKIEDISIRKRITIQVFYYIPFLADDYVDVVFTEMRENERAHLLRLEQEQTIYNNNKKKYRSLVSAEKTYTSLPAFVPVVINHPDPVQLTPLLSGQLRSRPTSRRVTPEVFMTSRSTRGGSSRPSTESSRKSNDSELSARHVRLGVQSPTTISSEYAWSRPPTVWSALRRKRHEREMRAELLMRNLQRRYTRLKPVGHALQKRQLELPLRLQKHKITIETQRLVTTPTLRPP